MALPRFTPGEDIRPLVPDVAYISYVRLRPLSPKDREVPFVAPEIVVEILSPDDRRQDVDETRRVYFAWGVNLELIADPDGSWVEVYDRDGRYERVDASVETYSPAIVPGLALPLRAMFAEMGVIDDMTLGGDVTFDSRTTSPRPLRGLTSAAHAKSTGPTSVPKAGPGIAAPAATL